MSAGSPGEDNGGEAAPAQDPWARPADLGQPGGAAASPPAESGGFASSAPSAWSAPVDWTRPAPPPWPSTDDTAMRPAGNGFGPAGADPWPAQPAAHRASGPQSAPPTGQYGYPPTGQYGYPPPYYPATAARANPVAIAALVCGIAQFLGFVILLGNILLAVPAVVCGAIALRQIRARGERGRGMAIAGLVLGIVGIVLFVLFLGLLILGLVYARHSS